jgi:prophage regulatory protein
MKSPPLQRSRRILRMAATEDKVGLKESQIREKVARGEFPKPVRLSASGRAVGFLEHELEEYLDERIAERDRGYVPSTSELARIEASREGRRKKREARAAEQAATARKPRGRKHVETAA